MNDPHKLAAGPVRLRSLLRSCGFSLALLTVLLSTSHALVAGAQSWTIEKIADTDTLVPGSTTLTFTTVWIPAISSGGILFFGRSGSHSSPDLSGLYLAVGEELEPVVSQGDPMPGSEGLEFNRFGGYSIEGNAIAFAGTNIYAPNLGIYFLASPGSDAELVADRETPIPGLPEETFLFVESPWTDGDRVAFRGFHQFAFPEPSDGVYLWQAGSLSTVADLTTAIPGGVGTFTRVLEPSLGTGAVAFVGEGGDGQIGIYLGTEDELDVIVDGNTQLGDEMIVAVSGPAVDDADLAFEAGFPGPGSEGGIYTRVDGVISFVVGTGTPIPGQEDDGLRVFDRPSFDDGNVAFNAVGPPGFMGVYTDLGGSLIKVIDSTEVLDGKTVSIFFVGREGLDGNRVAFRAVFTDGSHGIFLATPSDCFALNLERVGGGSVPAAVPSHSPGCPGGSYNLGESIDLAASPDLGWEIAGWSGTGDDSSAESGNRVKMPASDHTVVVEYAEVCFELALSHLGSGEAPSVTPQSSIGCAAQKFHYLEAIELTANPAVAWAVRGWTGTDNDATYLRTNHLTMPAAGHDVEVRYFPCHVRLENSTCDEPTAVAACTSITVGASYLLEDSCELTLEAGELIVLEDGVAVPRSAALAVGIVPELAVD